MIVWIVVRRREKSDVCILTCGCVRARLVRARAASISIGYSQLCGVSTVACVATPQSRVRSRRQSRGRVRRESSLQRLNAAEPPGPGGGRARSFFDFSIDPLRRESIKFKNHMSVTHEALTSVNISHSPHSAPCTAQCHPTPHPAQGPQSSRPQSAGRAPPRSAQH
jgi:hypothetical protein